MNCNFAEFCLMWGGMMSFLDIVCCIWWEGLFLMALSHVVGFGHFGEFLEFQQLRKVLKEL